MEGVEVDGLVLGLLVQGVDERGVGGAADDRVAVAEAPVDGQAGVAVGVGCVVEKSAETKCARFGPVLLTIL